MAHLILLFYDPRCIKKCLFFVFKFQHRANYTVIPTTPIRGVIYLVYTSCHIPHTHSISSFRWLYTTFFLFFLIFTPSWFDGGQKLLFLWNSFQRRYTIWQNENSTPFWWKSLSKEIQLIIFTRLLHINHDVRII